MLLMLCYVRMTAIGKFDPCVYVRVPIAKHNSCSRAVYGSVVSPRRCNYTVPTFILLVLTSQTGPCLIELADRLAPRHSPGSPVELVSWSAVLVPALELHT